MKTRGWLVVTATALGLAFGGAVAAWAADDEEQGMMPSFEDVDSNEDGAISRGEAVKVPSLDFVSADTNRDGVLSRTEYEAAMS
jgi:hypothetical protein